jgi:hypothetical protein
MLYQLSYASKKAPSPEAAQKPAPQYGTSFKIYHNGLGRATTDTYSPRGPSYRAPAAYDPNTQFIHFWRSGAQRMGS